MTTEQPALDMTPMGGRAGRIARDVAVAVLVVPTMLLVVAFLTWSSGLGAHPPATVAAALAGAGVVGFAGWGMWGHRGYGAVLTLAVSAAAAGVAVYSAVGEPYSHGRLRREVARINMPAGSKVIDNAGSGNILCFDACPEWSRMWHVPAATPEEADAVVTQALMASGFQNGRRGSINAFSSAAAPEHGPAPSGFYPVSVTVR